MLQLKEKGLRDLSPKKLFMSIIVTFFSIIFISACGTNNQNEEIGKNEARGEKKMSDQEMAEQYAEKMKPAIKKDLEKQDINHFIKSIHFKDNISISPMGYIVVKGYVNNDPDKYTFVANLLIDSNEVDTMSTSPELSEKFVDKDEEARLLKEAEEEEKQNNGK